MERNSAFQTLDVKEEETKEYVAWPQNSVEITIKDMYVTRSLREVKDSGKRVSWRR